MFFFHLKIWFRAIRIDGEQMRDVNAAQNRISNAPDLALSQCLQAFNTCTDVKLNFTLTAISKLRQVSLPRIRSRGWSETVEVSKNGRRSRIMGGRCGKSANTITGHALPATSRLTEMKNKLFVSRLPISSALAVF